MKAGFFTHRFSQFAPFETKRKLIGWNTGNIIFRDAIQKMIACDVLATHEQFPADKYSAFVTTDLIWLQEDLAPWDDLFKQLRLAGDKPLVPISIGLQSPRFKGDFKINPKMADYLKELQERVPLAVRGQYTAEILNAHGVSNTRVMGCPSIYQLPLYNNSLSGLLRPCPEKLSAVANFRTFLGDLTSQEIAFMKYVLKNFDGFIEQTFDPISKVGGVDEEMIAWLKGHSHDFFDLDSWRRHNLRYNFSLGLRFHGNIAALLADMPALFLTIDSRTSEMTDFLKLPAISLKDFDPDRPLRDYYEMADYTPFVASYHQQLDRFADYLSVCGLARSERYTDALDTFSASG